MVDKQPIYTGKDLVIVVPTKDRPEKIHNLLESIANQTTSCGRIIVVDGGYSVKDRVMSFSDRLPVEYFECRPPGQIRQRNMALSKIDERTPLVIYFDDDIVLMPNAFDKMINFWNTCEPETAGVSFNIINAKPDRHSWLKKFIGLSGPEQGRVLRSGRSTPILSVTVDLPTQWLCGGATVWKQDILKKNVNKDRYAKWAIAEDLLFSYPIGKLYPLYVCADAQVRHEHVYDHKIKMKYKYYGRTETLWLFYFVESHKELSRMFFLWMQLATIFARFVMGVASFQSRHFQFAIGQIEGVVTGLITLIRGRDLAALLDETMTAGTP